MKVIWIMDYSNGLVTKVRLSEERVKELESLDDAQDFFALHSDEFEVSYDDSYFMVTESEDVYEVEF